MLPELSGGGKTHHDLVLPAIGADFSDLNEPAAVVLLHVEVEPLRLLEKNRPVTRLKADTREEVNELRWHERCLSDV